MSPTGDEDVGGSSLTRLVAEGVPTDDGVVSVLCVVLMAGPVPDDGISTPVSNGPEVADQPGGAEGAALEKGGRAAGMDAEALPGAEEDRGGHCRRHQISEERLLHHGEIPAQTHEQRHEGEEKRRQEDTQYPPYGLILFYVASSQHP